MGQPGKYIVIYDISLNHERHAVSKILKGFGFRVQKSAFECMLLKSTKRKLIRELEAKSIESGTILIYRVNNNSKRLEIGVPAGPNIDDQYIYII